MRAGLAVLETLARTLSDDIWVVAPAEEQSGKGRSLTITEPVRFRRHAETPLRRSGHADRLGDDRAAEIMKDAKPDLILSGVNRGSNIAEDVSYSGTVSAAMEGALAGIRSIALSQPIDRATLGVRDPFDAAQAWGEQVLRPLVAMEWSPRTVINVNFPPVAADA
jgi:5'-nucleotidase